MNTWRIFTLIGVGGFIQSGMGTDHHALKMWAVVATVFVFRESRQDSLSAGAARLMATCVSFALCLLYLLIFPFSPIGMAALLGIGTLAMILLNRREDIVTTGITTAVVMVVAGMSPQNAWHQPLLRLIDALVGVAVGVACQWAASLVLFQTGTLATIGD